MKWKCAIVIAMCCMGQAADLPDGPGKEALQRVCTDCHELAEVVGARRTRAGWQRTIGDMVDRGAQGSEEDMAAILSYLTTYFGRVNVNGASAQELTKSLDLAAKEAQAIVAYREQHGKINDLDELKKVPGVSADKIESKRAMIAFRP